MSGQKNGNGQVTPPEDIGPLDPFLPPPEAFEESPPAAEPEEEISEDDVPRSGHLGG